MKEYYKRHLPHINPISAVYFITFRLINSLPRHIIFQLMEEFDLGKELRQLQKIDSKIRKVPESFHRLYFETFDSFLDNQKSHNNWLRRDEIAKIVYDAIHYRNGNEYDLICFTIMPNHVHMVIEVCRDDIPAYKRTGDVGMKYSVLEKILHSLKRYTAFECNKVLQRTGAFWQSESYDHIVRNEDELDRIIQYVMNNPEKAGIVKDAKEWKFSYCKYPM